MSSTAICRRWQERCNGLGLGNRPHIKTHKLAALARYQLALGAAGITVQKLGEAEVMADAGITDMLLTFNVVGAHKLRRLAELARRTDISVVADSVEVVAGIGEAGVSAGRDIRVLVECDTGARRNGVQSPELAAALAKQIDATRGVSYGGLMTYPRAGLRKEADAFLQEARELTAKAGLDTRTISSGGSPDMWKDEGLSSVTEYRAGTYVYFDRALADAGHMQSGRLRVEGPRNCRQPPGARTRPDRRRLEGADQRSAGAARLRRGSRAG